VEHVDEGSTAMPVPDAVIPLMVIVADPVFVSVIE
jgi:hypothetical protein